MSVTVTTNDEQKFRELERAYGDCKQLIAIDFGTFGCAAAYCSPGAPGYQKFVRRLFPHKDELFLRDGEKTLTALLIRNDESNEVIDIGYSAQTRYQELRRTNESHKYLYFEHFKRHLYNKDDKIHKNMTINAADNNGSRNLTDLIIIMLKQLSSASVEYVNDEKKAAHQATLTKDEVFWVVTIPAIWDEMCKEIMRYCIRKAGMKHFELALEPVAATFSVLNSRQDAAMREFHEQFKQNEKFIVLDCGGGTIDASCIAITYKNGDQIELSELHYGDGRFTGGLNVDIKFIETLRKLFANSLFEPCTKEENKNENDNNNNNNNNNSNEANNSREKPMLKTESKDDDDNDNDNDNGDEKRDEIEDNNDKNKNKKKKKGKPRSKNQEKLDNASGILLNDSVIVHQRREFTVARSNLKKGNVKANVKFDKHISDVLKILHTKKKTKLKNSKKSKKSMKKCKIDKMQDQITNFRVTYNEYDARKKSDYIFDIRQKKQKEKNKDKLMIGNPNIMLPFSSVDSDSNLSDSEIYDGKNYINPSQFWYLKSNYETETNSNPASDNIKSNSFAFALGEGCTNLTVNESGWKYLHCDVCDEISLFLYDLLNNIDDTIKHVILVGGFSNSHILRDRLAIDFPKIKFFHPLRPQLACVSGALYWICQKTRMKKVISKFSFGLAIDVTYEEDKQKSYVDKLIKDSTSPSGYILPNYMKWFVRVNEESDPIRKEMYDGFGFRNNTKYLDINLYATQMINKLHAEDEGVFLVKPYKLDIEKIFGNIKKKQDDSENKGKNDDKTPIKLELEYRDFMISLYVCDMDENRLTEAITIEQNQIEEIVHGRQAGI